MIGSYEFMIKSRVRPSDFSREGKQQLGFATLIMFALNFIRKSCQFIDLNDAITSWFYGEDDFKTFHGYRLSAVDGSRIEVPNTQGLRAVFGYEKNGKCCTGYGFRNL